MRHYHHDKNSYFWWCCCHRPQHGTREMPPCSRAARSSPKTKWLDSRGYCDKPRENSAISGSLALHAVSSRCAAVSDSYSQQCRGRACHPRPHQQRRRAQQQQVQHWPQNDGLQQQQQRAELLQRLRLQSQIQRLVVAQLLRKQVSSQQRGQSYSVSSSKWDKLTVTVSLIFFNLSFLAARSLFSPGGLIGERMDTSFANRWYLVPLTPRLAISNSRCRA